MIVGVIGLGRMGQAIAWRIKQADYAVMGYDVNEQTRVDAAREGIPVVGSVSYIAQKADVVWLLVPAGEIVDQVISEILIHGKKGMIIIDAGNSNFKDSVARAQRVRQHDMSLLDCGTSGGIHGKEKGFCLMVGGCVKTYEHLLPLLQAIAAPSAAAYVGPSGAGHYVKMIHNGIEYGLLQAYAEGFHLLKDGTYPALNLKDISSVWCNGSVIRSWLLELIRDIYAGNPDFEKISGEIAEGGTGKWTVENANEYNVPVPVIEKSLEVRAWSRKTGGNYATKLIALIRHAFGGHVVQEKK